MIIPRSFFCLLLLSLGGLVSAQAAYQHFEGRQVHPLAMTEDGTRLIAVDSANARVAVFDLTGASPVLQTQIPVGLEPVTVRARTNDEVWVVNEVGDSVSIVSLSTGTVIDTLRVGDEPTDVIFAAGMAYVACARDNQIRVFNAQTRALVSTISLSGLYPHALAKNADGSRVYAAFLLSGNRTTILPKEIAPAQPAPTNPALPPAPDTALIVAANDPRIQHTVLDRDVVEIDTSTQTIVGYTGGVGTNLFDLAVRPSSDQVWVANTESLNLTRFEPNLRGHFAYSRLSIVSPSLVTTVDLNPGIDYSLLPNPTAQATALSQPTSLVFTSDGAKVWLSAFASDRIARVDANTGAVEARVDIRIGSNQDSSAMRGARGLILDESRSRLYTLNKFSNSITVIDSVNATVVSEVTWVTFDPMPRAIREGRGYLFDARLSGNGTVSCGICHMDADRDGLAWDLGDPGGDMMQEVGFDASAHIFIPRQRNLHPMKGPMVTQTLRGMQNGAPFHWRGDRRTLQSFNGTFDKLMGGTEIDAEDMNDLADYLRSLVHHANPNRNLDRTPPVSLGDGNAVEGRALFNNHNKSHCAVCHVTPEGTDHNIDLPQEAGLSQPVKNPPLRTTYQRSFFDNRPGATTLSGFGLLHDGTGKTASLPIVHPYVLDLLETPQEFADVTAFIRAFDTGTAPTVGYSVTVTVANRNDSAVTTALALLESRTVVDASGAWDCDLVVRGKIGGVSRTLHWTGNAYRYDSAASGSVTRTALLASLSGADAITFMGVLPGSGQRLAVDEDEDGVLNGDDPDPGIINGRPLIREQPVALAVVPGAQATFTVVAEGLGLSYQWKRGTTNVGTNAATLSIPAAALADAGNYQVVVSNAFGSSPSSVVSLRVVPPPVITVQPVAKIANEGTAVAFSVTATGSNLTYQWMRGTALIGGATQRTLNFVGVTGADVGSYSVKVSNGAVSVTSNAVPLSVVMKPVVAPLNLEDALANQFYRHQLTATGNPTRFTVTGLPPGLVCNASTGLITGRATRVVNNVLVKVSATNAAGAGLVVEDRMNVLPFVFAGLGDYQGAIPRQAALDPNGDLGGHLRVTVTTTGAAFTGTLKLGVTSYPIRGVLDFDQTSNVVKTIPLTIPRRVGGPLALVLDFQEVEANSRYAVATLSSGAVSVTFPILRPQPVVTSVYTGNYTLAMKLSAGDMISPANPRGHSIGAFKVSTKGLVTGVFKLSDGSPAITLSSVVGGAGEVPVFSLLYANKGSLLGTLKIQDTTSFSLATSSLSWLKRSQTLATRSYKEGFGPLALDVIGGQYVIPVSPGIAMGLTAGVGNAKLQFAEGGTPDPATRLNLSALEIQKGSPAKILLPTLNPGKVRLTVTPGTGVTFIAGTTGSFAGGFELTDTDTSLSPNRPLRRTATFAGMIVDDGTGAKGYGFFNLAEMPSAGPPKTTAATSRLLSGSVMLSPTAP